MVAAFYFGECQVINFSKAQLQYVLIGINLYDDCHHSLLRVLGLTLPLVFLALLYSSFPQF